MPSIKFLVKGLYPRYEWEDGKVGSKAVFVGTHDETEIWMSLFLDLLYVCFFSRITELLKECEATTEVLTYCCSLIVIFFMSRLTIGYHTTIIAPL